MTDLSDEVIMRVAQAIYATQPFSKPLADSAWRIQEIYREKAVAALDAVASAPGHIDWSGQGKHKSMKQLVDEAQRRMDAAAIRPANREAVLVLEIRNLNAAILRKNRSIASLKKRLAESDQQVKYLNDWNEDLIRKYEPSPEPPKAGDKLVVKYNIDSDPTRTFLTEDPV